MKKVEIYTDGSCFGNPGVGGWGAILICGKDKREINGGEEHTTNNKMELMAAIKALEALKSPCEITLHTDSKYVQNGITSWIHNWQKNNWRTANKKEVKNKELWQELHELNQKHKINWQWVKAHNGHDLNERADDLARIYPTENS
jgi:ribonuclease HI